LVKKPTDYVWSSANSHAVRSSSDIIDASHLFKYVEIKQCEWKAFVDKNDDSDEMSNIRKHTMTGRPLGNVTFIQKLEEMSGDRLHALPVGRPKTAKNVK
jgi:putative transposase